MRDPVSQRLADILPAGWRVRRGIVDLHGDGFERHVAPRRGAVQDLGAGLRALDAELAANGITTAVLAQFWSWEGGMRGPDFARRLVAALAEHRDDLRTRMVVQLRVETHLLDDLEDVADFVLAQNIPYVVWNDHLPHSALAAGKRPPRLTGQALKSHRSPEAHLQMLQAMHARTGDVPAALRAVSARLRAASVLMGSHDDRDAQTRAMFADMGATIAEFPETESAVEAALQGGHPILLGAPNVVRGGSHKDGLSAGKIASQGKCTALVSDYHYPSLHLAAHRLAPEMGEDAAWSLISDGPANVLGLEAGMRARDCVVFDPKGRIAGTMVAGQWSHLTSPLAGFVTGL